MEKIKMQRNKIYKTSLLADGLEFLDIGPKIWAFYQGYMACHKDRVAKANKLIKEVNQNER